MKKEVGTDLDVAGLAVEWAIPAIEDEVPNKTSAIPRLVTATELYAGKIIEPRALIADLLWDGLTMLVAKPKAGKSWLTLQIAVYVAGGQDVEGIACIETGAVLYAALEEPESRTISRLRKIATPGPWAANLHFVYDLLPLMAGGSAQLSELATQLRPRLIIIDTLTALIKSGGSKRESDVFRSQYAEVSEVRKLAEQFKTAVILIHHTRKGVSDGAIEAVAGTGGVAAAVDAVWQLKRKPDNEATLDIVGRESEEQTLAMRFVQEPFGWQVLGDDAGLLLNAERRQILELLREEGPLSPVQIATELGKPRPGVRQLLKRMRDDCQIRKQGAKYIPLS
jgi:DNA-binding transcriptional ArsR family regulator